MRENIFVGIIAYIKVEFDYQKLLTLVTKLLLIIY
jgi:hypothetical protein